VGYLPYATSSVSPNATKIYPYATTVMMRRYRKARTHTRHPSWRGSLPYTVFPHDGRLGHISCTMAVQARLLSCTCPPPLCKLPEDDSCQPDSPYHGPSYQCNGPISGPWIVWMTTLAVRDYPFIIFLSSHSGSRHAPHTPTRTEKSDS
jgi:hypothetical protein